ncbi:MAG: DUF4270 domain-containing protein, partial [Muribaculaceae bacterium]|nr:DUF4270 domain-containing protein [Muribaculaceae bacterium]
VAPAGYEVEVEFPLTEIISSYRADSKSLTIVNGLTMTIPIDTIENSSKVTPPPYALMVLKKDKDEFFAKNKLPDNKTSFYAEYNSATKQYAFSSMTPYLQEMLAKEEEITADDYTFVIIPAQLTFESTTSSYYYQSSTQVVTEARPYLISPAMCELNLDDTKIKFTYSRQTR